MVILNTEYEQQKPQPSIQFDLDQKITKYIDENPDGNFEEVLKQDDSWQVYFQLSELRWGLYSWYNFGKDAALLEIGAGFGALTGLFCQKCKHVVVTERSRSRAEALVKRHRKVLDLEVYVGDVLSMDFRYKFDYVVLTGILERQGKGSEERKVYAEYLQKLKALLAPGGKLLLAVENRFGLKYICGAEEPHTGRPFDGLNHYPQGTGGYSFSKEELNDILKLAGLPTCKFYYPLPDYKLPQIIYSQNYLPRTRVGERLVPYYVKKDSLVAVETDLYDDIVENGVFEFFANSFLVECSDGAEPCSVDFATVTPDRGHKCASITAVYRNRTVTKEAVFKEGCESIRKLYGNIQELKEQRIPVIEMQMEGDMIRMPFVEEQLASAYLKQGVLEKRIDLYAYFEHLLDYIRQSSKQVSSEKNALLLWAKEGGMVKEGEESCYDFGVILSKAYIEMIPMNAFWVGGDFLFFDQEFVYSNYPANYVLFRALRNTYSFLPEAESVVPLENLKGHFKLKGLWNIYEERDNDFLLQVRRLEENKTFYNWTYINRERIYKKANLLNHRDEIIADYKVSDKMKRIWAVQLRLLETIKKVCQEHQLQFYMIRGTLLGAVRHKGFIPWDDDIDIALPREDYDRLLSLPQETFGTDAFLQTAENDRECFFGIYARLRDNHSTALDMKNWGRDCNQGVWIDIFPIDAYDMDEQFREKQRRRITKLYGLLYAKTYGKQFTKFGGLSNIKWGWYRFLSRLKKKQHLIRKLDEFCSYSRNPSTELVEIHTHYQDIKLFYKEDFKEAVYLEFEHRMLPAPIGYKRCLEMTVAKNYMVYPPVEERVPHHRELFIPELPFSVFNKRYVHSFQDAAGKDIILFGAGLMTEDYMRRFGKKYPPVFLVDNNPDKWGTKKCGLEVCRPEEILKIPEERRKLFLCNTYYKQIEEQLKKMGITEYCIYVQNRDWIVEDEKQQM